MPRTEFLNFVLGEDLSNSNEFSLHFYKNQYFMKKLFAKFDEFCNKKRILKYFDFGNKLCRF